MNIEQTILSKAYGKLGGVPNVIKVIEIKCFKKYL